MSLKTTRVVLSARIKTHPSIFLPIARLREGKKSTVIRPDSDLVIEGYWRCANHFATYAFIVAQPRPVHVAHHFHASAQLMLAARWNVPALMLIREPEAAAASATVFLEHDDPRPLLKFYNIFYKSLIPYQDRLVVSDFQRTVNDFGSVIAEINERYGRNYGLFHGTPEENARVEAMIREEHSENMDGNIAKFPLPSDAKERLKERVGERLASAECAALLDEARSYYEIFAKYSQPAASPTCEY